MILLPHIPPDEFNAKLSMIAMLSWGELQGWHRLISLRGAVGRNAFSGELAALHARAKQLGRILT